ncbi:sugar phosphate isomerase/epimerase [Microbacterium kribbense]|uniref:Sugar phosphate isomerase/epimerase n=2 Tax=Microbacterium kribbense TaxID=433645 RepID=A0ABP7GFY7_9MICO
MGRIGADVKFRDGGCRLAETPIMAAETLARLGFGGILVRTIDEAFPTLDEGDIEAFGRMTDTLGMFVRMGIGKINPYMTAELPRVRILGEGSYLAGMQRMIRLCGVRGWTEVWTAVGGFKPDLATPFCFDRFRTDVTWPQQLEATSAFIEKLAPTLRAEGVRLNIETHEEITTHELVRLVEDHGSDIVGVCFDPANLPVRGEAVLPGARRVAPFVHLTHLRDIIMARTDAGISRFLMPAGDGQIDWDALLGVFAAREDVDLLVEGVGGTRAEMILQPDDDFWRAAHPDLDADEISELTELADRQAERAAAGIGPDLAALRTNGDVDGEYREFLTRSLAALKLRLHAVTPLAD